MSTTRLEMLLRDTAAEIEYPPTPDLAFAVVHRMTHDPLVPRSRPRRAWLRPALVAAALIVLIGVFGLLFSPTVRRAAADLLGVVGIHIVVGEDAPAITPQPRSDAALQLGERVPIEEAQREVGFPILRPHGLLPTQRYAWLDRSIGTDGMVSFSYPVRPGFAPPPHGPILITQFEALVDGGYFKKLSATGGDVEFVTVRGTTGYWITGEPHMFWYVDSNGVIREETVRLAGNVLLWEQDGVTYRVEGADALSEARSIAESLR